MISVSLNAPEENLVFIHQPRLRFDALLCSELRVRNEGVRKWDFLEFGVAWINRLGAEALRSAAQEFIADGGYIQATVGVDFQSTSYEGLETLLRLEPPHQRMVTHVYCDENPNCTFHPKLFLFRNDSQARLYVGSNNLTGSGLSTNVEASLRVTLPIDDECIQEARAALVSWRDESGDTKPRRLTYDFLRLLKDHGYVSTESEIASRRRSSRHAGATRETRLFGRSHDPSPKRRAKGRGASDEEARLESVDSREVLLMRVRPRRTGTQVQLSMTVHSSSFMNNATEVFSGLDGSRRKIGYDHIQRAGKRVPNLARFEAPEMAGMTNPVARFRWIKTGDIEGAPYLVLQYEVFDADSSSEGERILERLEAGIGDPPVTRLRNLSRSETVLSRSDLDAAQWYRLDLA